MNLQDLSTMSSSSTAFLSTARDVPLTVRSANATSERRISPAMTLGRFKSRMEPVTGIPPSAMRLVLKMPGRPDVAMEGRERAGESEEEVLLGRWGLVEGGEILIEDTRPAAMRNINMADLASVEKYTMPAETYSALSDSVLAWKRDKKLGRFDPNAPEIERTKIEALWADVDRRGIEVGKRCQLGSDSSRRGQVAYVGRVPEIPGLNGPWVGVVLDEPTGKNDGSVGGTRYFECKEKCGAFVRAERVEVGDFGVLMDEELDEDLEEI